MWTVLLVEDEAFVRRSIRKGMPWEENGFKVIEECGNGQEAMEFIRNKQPDLVICDIMMPVMNGVELLAQVRRENLGTAFVMLTVMRTFLRILIIKELLASYVPSPLDAACPGTTYEGWADVDRVTRAATL